MQVFAWDQYYPAGGYNDYIGEASSMEAAYTMLLNQSYETYQLVESGRVIGEGSVRYIRDLQAAEPQPETETWHCNGCDEDLPHIILFRGETLPETVQTQCTGCKRETYR